MTINSIEERILARAQFKMNMDAKVIQAGKFNNVSTQEERRAILESLLSKDYSDENNEDEFTNLSQEEQDAVINSMISRNEDELRLYEEYDAERHIQDAENWKAAGHSGEMPGRLVGENELPDWLKHGELQIEQRGGMVAYGRGKRERSEINYNDTEIDKVRPPFTRQTHIMLTVHPQLIEGSSDEGESAGGGGSSAAAGASGGASRPVVATPGKRKVATDAPAGDSKRGRKPGRPPRAPPSQDTVRAHQLYKQVYEDMRTQKDEATGRQLMKIFLRLPPRTQLPDYYALIAQPMDMARIQKKLDKAKYATPAEFKADFTLMFKNAQQYNAEGSDVYNDARRLQAAFDKRFETLLADLAKPPPAAAPAPAAVERRAEASEEGSTSLKLSLKRRKPVTPEKPAEVAPAVPSNKRNKRDDDEDDEDEDGVSV